MFSPYQVVAHLSSSNLAKLKAIIQSLSHPAPLSIAEDGLSEPLPEETSGICLILDMDLPIIPAYQKAMELNVPIFPFLYATKGASPEKIKATYQKHAIFHGLLTAETDNLLKCGVRLATHICPKATAAPLIKKSLFFSNLTVEEQQLLIESTNCYTFFAGEALIERTDPSDFFFVILEGQGEALLFPDPHSPITFPINCHACAGEVSAIERSPRTGTCLAIDKSIVLKVGAHLLDGTHPLAPKLLAALSKEVVQRLKLVNSQLAHEGNKQSLSIPKVKRRPDQQKGKAPSPSTIQKKTKKEPKEQDIEEEAPEREENPFSSPTGQADQLLKEVQTQEEYDVLKRKIHLRNQFILGKVPRALADSVTTKLFGYLTGSKLAKVNPHHLWREDWFSPGASHLQRALHLVVCSRWGFEAYKKSFLQLPFSQRVVGMLQRGCAGTFLGDNESIDRYLEGKNLKEAIPLDLEVPIDRLWYGEDCIEFLTHTNKDVRDDTLFLVLDGEDGETTAKIRNAFKNHQMITIVRGLEVNPKEPGTLFNLPEEKLDLPPRPQWNGKGFYQGETFFLADLAPFFSDAHVLKGIGGSLFGAIGILAQLGPDYSGTIWGSKGGAEGAVRAARAMYGVKGAQSSQDLADAVNWADQ